MFPFWVLLDESCLNGAMTSHAHEDRVGERNLSVLYLTYVLVLLLLRIVVVIIGLLLAHGAVAAAGAGVGGRVGVVALLFLAAEEAQHVVHHALEVRSETRIQLKQNDYYFSMNSYCIKYVEV